MVGVEVFSDVTKEIWEGCHTHVEMLRKEHFDLEIVRCNIKRIVVNLQKETNEDGNCSPESNSG
jgi:hypothetical protein